MPVSDALRQSVRFRQGGLRSWRNYELNPRKNPSAPRSTAHRRPLGTSIRSRAARFQTVHRLRGTALVETLSNLARQPAQHGGADPLLLSRLSNHLQSFIDELRPVQILECMEAFARLGYADSPLMMAAVASFQEGLSACGTASLIARFVHASSALRFCSDAAVKPLVTAVVAHVNHMKWQDIVLTLHGLAHGLGYHLSSGDEEVYRPFWVLLELLVYRARLLMVYKAEGTAESALSHADWRLGEVAHLVAPLRPRLVRELITTLLESEPPADQTTDNDATGTDFNHAALQQEVFCYDPSRHDLVSITQKLQLQQLVYLLGACNRIGLYKHFTQALESAVRQRLSFEDAVNAPQYSLGDVMFHMQRAGVRNPQLLQLCTRAFNTMLETQPHFCYDTSVPCILHALTVLRSKGYRQTVRWYCSPSLLHNLSRYSAENLALVLHGLCLSVYSVKRGSRSARTLLPFQNVLSTLLKCLQMVHRQLTLSQRRVVQLCLAYLCLHLPHSPIGAQALHLARLFSLCPSAMTSRKKNRNLNGAASTSSNCGVKNVSHHPSKLTRFVKEASGGKREEEAIPFDANFCVAPEATSLPLCPRNFPLYRYDIIQVGPCPVLQLVKYRHGLDHEKKDDQLQHLHQVLSERTSTTGLRMRRRRKRRRLLKQQWPAIEHSGPPFVTYATFSSPFDYDVAFWSPTYQRHATENRRATALGLPRAFELYVVRSLLKKRHPQESSGRSLLPKHPEHFILLHKCMEVIRQHRTGSVVQRY